MINHKTMERFLGTTKFQTENRNLQKEVVRKGAEKMKTQYLRILIIALVLIFVSQGCSVYAGFSVKQKSPQSVKSVKTVENVQQEKEATN